MGRFINGKVALAYTLGAITPFVIVAVAGWLGLLPVNSNSKPPDWETAFAHQAFNASVARQAPHLDNPVAPTEANLMSGAKMFKGDCSGCHGTPNTAADNEGHPTLYPMPPQFALHHPNKPDYELFWIIQHGVRYSGMFVFGGAWKKKDGTDPSDEKIWTLVTFLKHLDSLPPEVDAEWHKSD